VNSNPARAEKPRTPQAGKLSIPNWILKSPRIQKRNKHPRALTQFGWVLAFLVFCSPSHSPASAQDRSASLKSYRERQLTAFALKAGYLQRRPGTLALGFGDPFSGTRSEGNAKGAGFTMSEPRDLQLTLAANQHLLRTARHDRNSIGQILKTLSGIKGINALVIGPGILSPQAHLAVLLNQNKSTIFLPLEKNALDSFNTLRSAVYQALGYNAVALRLPSGAIEIHRVDLGKTPSSKAQVVVFKPDQVPIKSKAQVAAVLAPTKGFPPSGAIPARTLVADSKTWTKIAAAPAIVIEE
jgi:hypothetical protein